MIISGAFLALFKLGIDNPFPESQPKISRLILVTRALNIDHDLAQLFRAKEHITAVLERVIRKRRGLLVKRGKIIIEFLVELMPPPGDLFWLDIEIVLGFNLAYPLLPFAIQIPIPVLFDDP